MSLLKIETLYHIDKTLTRILVTCSLLTEEKKGETEKIVNILFFPFTPTRMYRTYSLRYRVSKGKLYKNRGSYCDTYIHTNK